MAHIKLRKTHNWNQIHYVVTTTLGYRSHSRYRDLYVYYRRGTSPIIPIKKANNLSKEYVQKVMPLFGISYEEFVALYTIRDKQ